MTNHDKILRRWVRAPERWQELWKACQHGGGQYRRGLFVLHGHTRPAQQSEPRRTREQIIVELLKNEPMGYLS